MNVNDLFTFLTRYFLIFLAATTFIGFLRRRDKVRRDIALVIICLASGSIFRIIQDILGVELPWLSKVSQIALLAQPFLLLRLVDYFRPVSHLVYRGALAGMVISWIMLLLAGTPLPPLVTLPIIIYFVAVDGYAVFAFIKGAFSTVGVVRQRLRFTAAGSALLIVVLFIAGLRVAFPTIWTNLTPFVQILTIFAIASYYLGFAPPRWMRQSWQLSELRDYLQQVPNPAEQSRGEILDQLCQAVTRTMGTDNVAIALWEKARQELVFQKISNAVPLDDLNLDGVIREAWKDQKPRVVYKSPQMAGNDLRLMEKMDAETLLIIPIETNENVLGLLMVFLEYGSLFIDDDLNLLTIFTQQTAILLENHAMVEELHRYTEDLERKVQERTGALQRSNEELKRFAYVASHDLQEPLRMVSLYLQLLESRYSDKLDADAHEFIGYAVDGATRMKNLIGDLLIYSRVDAQQRDFTEVNLQKVMADICKIMEASIQEAQANVTVDKLPTIKGDEQILSQLFQNLIGNALKYRSTRQPEIHVGVTRQNDQWLFSVQDNGIGIEKQYLERIFVIFQRLHDRTQYPGTGIGLAICKKAVELHGGRIWAVSEVDKGTTFFFSIPALIPTTAT